MVNPTNGVAVAVKIPSDDVLDSETCRSCLALGRNNGMSGLTIGEAATGEIAENGLPPRKVRTPAQVLGHLLLLIACLQIRALLDSLRATFVFPTSFLSGALRAGSNLRFRFVRFAPLFHF